MYQPHTKPDENRHKCVSVYRVYREAITAQIKVKLKQLSLGKGKGHPVKSHDQLRGGSRFTDLLILDLCAGLGWVVKATPRPLYPLERDPIPIVQDTEWGLSAGLDGHGEKKIFCLDSIPGPSST
jgi:hypothetical protein